ncbi:hypothetical protein M404DRAFT_998986 [Pisolithus tinctorius Marx 270]|uniref:Uncharacterized protein n=1 Tax=Pisolithus tinctorius Marx 270 TaxID=870435 RepID=A0A0C3NZU4_PISTI|nr:hypothetical protein M404DRAFT_998986 [Pisolithus tinctorius Marx 270]
MHVRSSCGCVFAATFNRPTLLFHLVSRSWVSHPNFTGSGLAPLPSFSRFFQPGQSRLSDLGG